MFQAQLHVLIADEQHKDLLRQVERDRLINLANPSPESDRWYYRALEFIGKKLIAWGNDLQRQHDTAPNAL